MRSMSKVRFKRPQGRAKGGPGFTPQQSQQGLQKTGEMTMDVAPWKLPAPDLEYFAERAEARTRDGTYSLNFYQLDLEGEKLLNGVSVSMSPHDFDRFVEAFGPLLELVRAQQAHELGDGTPREIPKGTLGQEATKKLMANMARGGTRMGSALIDFYRVSILNEEQLLTETQPARGVLRVLMVPMTFCELVVGCLSLGKSNV